MSKTKQVLEDSVIMYPIKRLPGRAVYYSDPLSGVSKAIAHPSKAVMSGGANSGPPPVFKSLPPLPKQNPIAGNKPLLTGIKQGYWPDPTPDMLQRDDFEAVWQVIKKWDINVPSAYNGYCGATGNHVRAILDALDALNAKKAYDKSMKGI